MAGRSRTAARLAALLGRLPANAPYRKFLAASYAENTRRSYASDIAHFKRWGARIPCNATSLAEYIAAFAETLSYATLVRRVAAIHREHLSHGHRSPARSELVRATLRGIARTYTRQQRQVRPILREHLLAMAPRMCGTSGARDRAILLVGFLGGFRRSELAARASRANSARAIGFPAAAPKPASDLGSGTGRAHGSRAAGADQY